MLKKPSTLIKGFQEAIDKSEKHHGEKLEEIRQLIFTCIEFRGSAESGDPDSLVFWSFMESFRTLGQTLYLCYCGLYRNAYDNIRHVLESIVQAYYIDSNHTSVDLRTKLEILKEVEDKKEYHASRLIEEKISFKSLDCTGLDCKGLLKKEYTELSRIIHPSHEKIMATVKDVVNVLKEKWLPVKIDGEEITKVFESLKQMLDILLFLVIASFPKWKDSLSKNEKLAKNIQKYNLRLVETILSK